jgi:hypothetical protein
LSISDNMPPPIPFTDDATMKRAMQVRRMMNESILQRTPQERDRMMQVHLAQARGTTANAFLLRCAMNFALRLRQARSERDAHDDG